ncbi:hypothetical protein SAMN05216360_11821 [Methylobacterium phyllostachyos]|uniref:O-Antigen ligase n=1 Tax=Methylobacterium phyllostachyos TaxID=582672 RepID=A0A1H0I5P2_9HYPH|nr:hypothetical protein [Methylobacterium phyllostachyos]SDO26746.1 hypothetical protein SAMN05216360_11821 [Methylobacterium phyllostachyos]
MDGGTVVAWILILGASLRGVEALFKMSVFLLAFNALAVAPPAVTGGVSITAPFFCFLLFAVRIFLREGPKRFFAAAFSLNLFGLYTLFILYGVVATYLFPIVFGGEIFIYPMQIPTDGISILQPLTRTSSNITQASYMTLSFLMAISVGFLATETDVAKLVRGSIYPLVAIIVITGALDLLNLNEVLAFFRNANYALVADTQIGSIKRIVGATPEASSFGFLAAGCFSILLLLRGVFRIDALWLVSLLLCLAFSCLSASSTAYGMIFTAFIVCAVQQTFSVLFGNRRDARFAVQFFLASSCAAIVLLLVLYTQPFFKEKMFELADQLIFEKSLTSSYEERSRWSKTTLDSFFSSGGLGIGLGSARSSNSLINVLASTGVPGSAFLILFFLKIFLDEAGLRLALSGIGPQLALIPILAGLALSGTTPDLGPFVAVLIGLHFGLIDSVGLRRWRPVAAEGT